MGKATEVSDEKIREMLDEWDRSGAIKTSAYYRLQAALHDPKQKPRTKETRDEKTPLRSRHS